MDLHENLEYQFRENLMEMGKGHKEAAEQPDYENEWLKKTVENDARAVERGQQAVDKLHLDMLQNENQRNLHILHRFVFFVFRFNDLFLFSFTEKLHSN